MIISNLKMLDDFVQRNVQAIKPLNQWIEKVKKETWTNHVELKESFRTADYVGNGRYVFNVGGNRYRLVVVIIFVAGVMEVRFVGTHAEYDKIKNCSEL